MSEDAKVQVSVEGAAQVKKAFDDMIAASKRVAGAVEDASKKTAGLGDSASKAGKFWKDVGKDITSSLQTVATSAIATVTAVNTISFAQAIQSAKALDDQMARFATGSGRSIGGVREEVRRLSRDTNTTEGAVLSWSKSLGRVTYDSKAAMQAYKAFADEALASNQDISDQGGLAAALSNGLGVKGDGVQGFLDQFRGMSEEAGNAGGFNAAKDQLASLEGAMSQLNFATAESKKEFAAFQLTLAKGQSPQQAQRVQQGVMSFVESHGEGLAREYGRNNVYDKDGRINAANIPFLLKKIQDTVKSRHGSNSGRAFAQIFGSAEVGAAVANFDPAAFNGIADSRALHDGAASVYQTSAEGQRAANDIRRDQGMEDAARNTFGIQDALGQFGADHPILSSIAGTLGTASVAKAFGVAGWKALMGGGTAAAAEGTTVAGGTSLLTGGAGTGLLGAGGMFLGATAAQLGLLTAATAPLNQAMPQVRQETQDALETHREGLARAVVAGVERGGADGVEGSLGPATLGAVRADPALASLLQQLEQERDTISGLPDNLAKAVAEALKGSPLNVHVINQTGGPIQGANGVNNKNTPQ